MRRKEFKIEDRNEIEKFLNKMSFGFLGTASSDDFPNIVPLNYIWALGNIYFHGARTGRKVNELKQNANVTFAVADEVALIPSYFNDEKYACPATSFFKSVIVYGSLEFVIDMEEKIFALDLFMKKLQPGGGYEPFNLEDEEYKKNIKGVNVFKITPSKISAKFKFGQNRDEKSWENTKQKLLKRNLQRDKEAAENMDKTCPFKGK